MLLHLYRYRALNQNEIYNNPWELTQDGIATTLCISRAHASIELKKLRNKGRLSEHQVHVKGGKVKRFVYYLNPDGLAAAAEVQRKADDAGVDVKTLLDLKSQNATVALDGMTQKDRFALGCACAFRVPVPLTLFEEHERSIIPADVTGRTVIGKDVRSRYLSAVDESERKTWHGFAVNQWIDNHTDLNDFDNTTRVIEKTYHLIMAGVHNRACSEISKNFSTFIYLDDREFLDSLLTITDPPERYLIDVLSVTCEIAINLRDFKVARETAERLSNTVVFEGDENEASGDAQGHAYLAEIYLLRGLEDEAMKQMSMIRGSGNMMAKVMLADILIDMKEFEQAAMELDDTKGIPRKDGDAIFRKLYVTAKLNAAISREDGLQMRPFECVPEFPPSEAQVVRMMYKANAASGPNGQRLVKALAKNYGYWEALKGHGSS